MSASHNKSLEIYSLERESKSDSNPDTLLKNLLATEHPTLEQITEIINIGLSYSGVTSEQIKFQQHQRNIHFKKWNLEKNYDPIKSVRYLRFALQLLAKNNLRIEFTNIKLTRVLFEIYKSSNFNAEILYHTAIGFEYANTHSVKSERYYEIRNAFHDLALNQAETFDALLAKDNWEDVECILPAYLRDFIAHRNLITPLPMHRNLDIYVKYKAAQKNYDNVIDDYINEKKVKPEILLCHLMDIQSTDGTLNSKLSKLEAKSELSIREKIIWYWLNSKWPAYYDRRGQAEKPMQYYQDIRVNYSYEERAILVPALVSYQFVKYINGNSEAKQCITEEIAFFENAYRNKPDVLSLLALTTLSRLATVSISLQFNPSKINSQSLELLQRYANDYPYLNFVLGHYYCYQITKLKNVIQDEKQTLGKLYLEKMKTHYTLAAASGYAPAVEKYLKHYCITPDNFSVFIGENKDFYFSNNVKIIDDYQRSFYDGGERAALFRFFAKTHHRDIFTEFLCDTKQLECLYHTRLAVVNPSFTWHETMEKVIVAFNDFAKTKSELFGELVRNYNDLDEIKAVLPLDIYQNFLEKRIAYLNTLMSKYIITKGSLHEHTELIPDLCDIVFRYLNVYFEKDINELAKLNKALNEILPLPSLQIVRRYFQTLQKH